MAGFQLVGGEILPIVADSDAPQIGTQSARGENASLGRGPVQQALPGVGQPVVFYQPVQVAAGKAKPTTPRSVVKAARARVRELDREIKRIEKLRAERDELKRLLAAATGNKTSPAVPRETRSPASR